MSRRIVYVFTVAACAAFVAPAAADRECFDSSCRMPEVIEPPQAPPAEEQQNNDAVPEPALAQSRTTEPVRPQMSVDPLPRPALKPLVPAEPKRQIARAPRASDGPGEPVEVFNRPYAANAPAQAYSQQPYSPQAWPPNAGVVVVAPGLQYGEDGVAVVQGRQDASWQLCQSDRRDRRCGPYNYQPYGVYGYRPLGSYRPHRSVPAYVYVPDAKVIVIDPAD